VLLTPICLKCYRPQYPLSVIDRNLPRVLLTATCLECYRPQHASSVMKEDRFAVSDASMEGHQRHCLCVSDILRLQFP
jgi:hypothetical protein